MFQLKHKKLFTILRSRILLSKPILQFGNGLQQMLTTVPYSELAGQRNIEWDALLMCANFMKLWPTLPQVVKDMSGHHETEEKLSDEQIDKLIQSQ